MKRMAFLLLLWAAGCSPSAAPKPPIRIGINVWPGYAHAFLAQEKGFFKNNGVEVELILKTEQSVSFELYRNAGCDGLFTVLPDVILLNSEGNASKAVCIVDVSTTGDVLVAGPKVRTLADLKGKTVGFEGVNSFSHIFVLKALEKAGLGENDVFFKNVPAHQVLAELENGSIQAGHTWNPTKWEALRKGYKVMTSAGDVPGIIIDVLVFNGAVIQERPEEVKAVVKALFEARDYLESHREEALEIMSRSEGMSKEMMVDGLQGLIQPSLTLNREELVGSPGSESRMAKNVRTLSGFYMTHGQVNRDYSADEILDPRFIKELSE
jgi:NitT/TauT family transport system substrate-binding protein